MSESLLYFTSMNFLPKMDGMVTYVCFKSNSGVSYSIMLFVGLGRSPLLVSLHLCDCDNNDVTSIHLI